MRTGISLLANLRELREVRDAGFISEVEEAHAKGRLLLASHLDGEFARPPPLLRECGVNSEMNA